MHNNAHDEHILSHLATILPGVSISKRFVEHRDEIAKAYHDLFKSI